MYLQNLEQMKTNYKAPKSGRFMLKLPHWTCNSPYKQIKLDMPLLATKGSIVYGAILQANNNLFRKPPKMTYKPNDSCYPACVIYSEDPYYLKNPTMLGKIGAYLFSYKESTEVPDDLKEIVALIKDDYAATFNLMLPNRITPNGCCYYTNLLIWRKHLPKWYLSSNILPLLVKSDCVSSIMVLPRKYWSKTLKKHY